MIMKTAKITEVNEVKEWGEGDRKTFYHNLTLDNGDKINIGKKSQLSVGTEVNYEITDTSGQHEFSKAKSVNPEFQKKGSGDLKGIKIGHAITNAVSVVCAHCSITSDQDAKDQIKKYAKMIYELSEELNQEL